MPTLNDRETINDMCYADLARLDEVPDVAINVIGNCTSRGYFRYRLHAPTFFMRFMIGGDGAALCDGREIRLARDDVFLYWPGDVVDLSDVPGSPWRFVWISLVGRDVAWVIQSAGFPPGTRSYRLREGNDVVPAAIEVFARFKHGGFNPIFPAAAAWQLIWRTAEHLGFEAESGKAVGVAGACRDYIRHHLGPIRIAALAERFGVNRSTLFRLFVERYAMSPKDYVEQVRFERACQLLASSTLTVKEVAARCHYDSAEYFTRRFREKFGRSPTRWSKERRMERG